MTIQLTCLGLLTVPAPWWMSGENTGVWSVGDLALSGFVFMELLDDRSAEAEIFPICKWDFVNRCNHQSKVFILTGLFS